MNRKKKKKHWITTEKINWSCLKINSKKTPPILSQKKHQKCKTLGIILYLVKTRCVKIWTSPSVCSMILNTLNPNHDKRLYVLNFCIQCFYKDRKPLEFEFSIIVMAVSTRCIENFQRNKHQGRKQVDRKTLAEILIMHITQNQLAQLSAVNVRLAMLKISVTNVFCLVSYRHVMNNKSTKSTSTRGEKSRCKSALHLLVYHIHAYVLCT